MSKFDRNLIVMPNIVKPLDHPVNAEQHTAVYKMHRYYARRPWNVFAYIIKHYTKEGDIILDPFCGGGVTVVEGLKQIRKVIGVDLNPLATFITKMEVEPLDIAGFRDVYINLKKQLEPKIFPLYKTTCENCGNDDAYAEWYKWSNVFECPLCQKDVILAETEKKANGIYRCSNKSCGIYFRPTEARKTGEKIISVKTLCRKCKGAGIRLASARDRENYKKIEDQFEKVVREEKLWYPKDNIPDENLTRENAVFERGVKRFSDLFTRRNLLANSITLKAILEMKCSGRIRDFLVFGFSCNLSWTSILSNDTGHGWQHHAFWLPDIFFELNVLDSLDNRILTGSSSLLKGKLYSNEYVGTSIEQAGNFDDLKADKDYLLLNMSSDELPFNDNSVDVIVTDPPFGGNVNYAELSNFWIVWLNPYLNRKGIIDSGKEAIQTRHQGFENAKDIVHYEETLYKIFKECFRILKRNGYMVLTFHNKDIEVWMALHRAANRAGFKLPSTKESENRGIIYQPPSKIIRKRYIQRK